MWRLCCPRAWGNGPPLAWRGQYRHSADGDPGIRATCWRLFGFSGDLYGRHAPGGVSPQAARRAEVRFLPGPQGADRPGCGGGAGLSGGHGSAPEGRPDLAVGHWTQTVNMHDEDSSRPHHPRLEAPQVIDYKTTLNLPTTDFPMKANLAQREPEMLARWNEMDLYGRCARCGAAGVRAARRSALRQRDDSHRPRRQQGAQGHHRQVPHPARLRRALRAGLGLPRPAHRAGGGKKLGKVGVQVDARQFRTACREFAAEQIAIQSADFQRLGVLGDWENPYLTMDSASRPTSCARWRGSSPTGISTGAPSRCTGASTAARRWPRPRSSTKTARRRRSTCASRSWTRPSSRALRARRGASGHAGS